MWYLPNQHPNQYLNPNLLSSWPIRTTEPVIGYRLWLVRGGDLWSVVYHYRWPRFVPMRKRKDGIDSLGIHALKQFEHVVLLFEEFSRGSTTSLVAGTVSLWGRVTEMERGYLAEFAYPKQLFVGDMDPLTVMQLEDNYGVPCEIRGRV
ncbi:MAG: hypothetical protein ACREBG_14265 [Pyrinomonadaceae bacterium]